MSLYLDDVRRTYRNYKSLADAAVAQTSDEDLFRLIDPDANSMAIVMQHLAGNLRSRFDRFLTSDGEKADRDRDGEFEPRRRARADVLQHWEWGWGVALGEIDALTASDLDRTVTIRGEPFTVAEALNRSVTHTAYHVGQIVLLAKHFAGPNWTSLSIPKGRSSEYLDGTFKQRLLGQKNEDRS